MRTVLWVLWAGVVPLLGACGGADVGSGGPVTSTPATTTGTASADRTVPTGSTGSTDTTTEDPAGVSPVPKVFDETSMRKSVRSVLVDGYDIDAVQRVSCPPKQPVRAGTTFDCTAVIGGETKQVPITVENARGRYQVGYPEDPVRS